MKKEYWIFIAILIVIALGAYAVGHYSSSTSEVIDPSTYGKETARSTGPQQNTGTFPFTDAGQHIGELATIEGTPVTIYTSKKGTVFFDYCEQYDSCPFSAVIFSSDATKFGNLSKYKGKIIRVTGSISSYQGRAEIIIKDLSQITIP